MTSLEIKFPDMIHARLWISFIIYSIQTWDLHKISVFGERWNALPDTLLHCTSLSLDDEPDPFQNAEVLLNNHQHPLHCTHRIGSCCWRDTPGNHRPVPPQPCPDGTTSLTVHCHSQTNRHCDGRLLHHNTPQHQPFLPSPSAADLSLSCLTILLTNPPCKSRLDFKKKGKKLCTTTDCKFIFSVMWPSTFSWTQLLFIG